MVRIQQVCAMQEVSGFESAGEHGVSLATKGEAPEHPLFYGGINFTKEHVLRLAITPGTSSVDISEKKPVVAPKVAKKSKTTKNKHSMKLRDNRKVMKVKYISKSKLKRCKRVQAVGPTN